MAKIVSAPQLNGLYSVQFSNPQFNPTDLVIRHDAPQDGDDPNTNRFTVVRILEVHPEGRQNLILGAALHLPKDQNLLEIG